MESSKTLQTKLKKATQALSEQKEALHRTRDYLENVLENSRDMIFRADSDDVLVSFSKGGESALGYTLDDAGDSPMVEINISDAGVGISRKDQKSIYEYFYTTKPPGKGTGLGLPISRNIIKNLGGSLSLESEPGEGATFTIRLPIS